MNIGEDLIEEVRLALNAIPRTKYRGTMFSDTYQLAAAIGKALKPASPPTP